MSRHWAILSLFGFLLLITAGISAQIVNFNNRMVELRQMQRAEIEATKAQYGQCIARIIESGQIRKPARADITALANEAGGDLEAFNTKLLAMVETQAMPQLPPQAQENAQRAIVECRKAYVGRVDYGLKPMYDRFNELQSEFPNTLYNKLFFHWQPDEIAAEKNG